MEHVNGWCFRGIYKGVLWEDDLHVSAHLHDSNNQCIILRLQISFKMMNFQMMLV